MSTLNTQLGTTVCSDFSTSVGDFDPLEQLFEETTGSMDGGEANDRDEFGGENSLYYQVKFKTYVRILDFPQKETKF